MALFHLNDRPGEPGSALSPAEPSPQQVVGQQTGRQLFKALAPLVLKPGLPFLVEQACLFFFFFKRVVVFHENGPMKLSDNDSYACETWPCCLCW